MFKEIAAGPLKPFQITVGLIEGYGSKKVRTVAEVEDILAEWMKKRANKKQPFLTGNVIAGNLIYTWSTKLDPKSTKEPSITFVGNVNPIYNSDLDDGEVLLILENLASFLGEKLNQVRVYVSYMDKIVVLQDDSRAHPTD